MSSSRTRRCTAAALVAVLVLASCGSSDALKGKVVKDGLGCSPSQVDRGKAAPTVTKVAEAPKKVVKKDLTKGKGCPADSVSYLTLDLVGATATDAKVFTDTWKSGRPVTAKLGTGQLLPALDTALEGLKVGGQRQITLPADSAYGKDGNAAQGIGPDQALIFVVELVAVSDTPLFCAEATSIPKGKSAGKPTTVAMPVEAPTKLITEDLKTGTGEVVGKNRYATVEYLGVSCITGNQFASSWDDGEPITAALGTAPASDSAFSVIPGWSEGLATARVGSVRQLEIPFSLAYGTAGKPPTIAASEPLVFIIQVLKVSDKPPATSTTTSAPTTTTGG
ncbi:FKBP-type peptidyl-prolyl cis-trans isomerase [Aquihabitans sp. G128]|uniref:FKBP-type peptidyl-prolyl cis-trans isomerase n=1 Tax=Aquihabitans sp. G128 TaxID=2849779 RepID=UPI001C24B6FC|nr:FKBP-type peptidyl-prolyl cis-trans isomerase [Aquihabitans sp. G128]QXC60818.1 FKBP-type peptidyl-prolyl cis-trans isomerase [Aquihabitans sp. G128]